MQRQLADFVEKTGPLPGGLQDPAPKAMRARKCAAFMPEELRFKQVLRNRGTIDRDKGKCGPAAIAVYRAGDLFLARTGLSGDQNGRGNIRHPRDPFVYLDHTG